MGYLLDAFGASLWNAQVRRYIFYYPRVIKFQHVLLIAIGILESLMANWSQFWRLFEVDDFALNDLQVSLSMHWK